MKGSANSEISIAIVGGGLAGVAAASAARCFGFKVTLFEQSAYLGGRVHAFDEPWNRQTVDSCPHAAMGCCVNFIDLIRRAGIVDLFERRSGFPMLAPNVRADFSPSRLFPAPLHFLPTLRKLPFLTSAERTAFSSALLRLARLPDDVRLHDASFGQWLRENGQTESIVEKLWDPVALSALGDAVDLVSVAAARQVFVSGFLHSRQAAEIWTPNAPWREVIDRRLGDWLAGQGTEVVRRRRVMWIGGSDGRCEEIVFHDGEAAPFDAVILAVPWHQAFSLLTDELQMLTPELEQAASLPSSEIAAVHLWYDRPLGDFKQALLVTPTAPWLFRGTSVPTPGKSVDEADRRNAYLHQVVFSGSQHFDWCDEKAGVAAALDSLQRVLPEVGEAKLLHARVVRQAKAVFTRAPGAEKLRPTQKTAVENLFLAGDWTAIGWPATMEGAVRSGYLAVEALLESLDQKKELLAAELPTSWLTRKLLKRKG